MRTGLVGTPTCDLFVYEWGEADASPLLYWDGLGGTGLHANEIAPILTDRFGWRVIAPDPPGHGRSSALPAAAYRPSGLAEIAAGLLDHLGLSESAFVGFSVGAEVACAFAARYPDRTTGIALVDGGHWDFADLDGFDTGKSLSAHVDGARQGRREETYPSWGSYFDAEQAAIGRWTAALEEAHRATMREEDGQVVPIAGPETVGGIHHGNCVEPTASTHTALRESSVPALLVTAPGCSKRVARAGIRRFRANVPQLQVRQVDTDVHDLVSRSPLELATIIGGWRNTALASRHGARSM